MDPITAQGYLRFHRNFASSDCTCCTGPHVFSRSIEQDDGSNLDQTLFLTRALREMPEGAVVRISVEVVEEEESADEGETPA